jgi:hypothetical protein
MYEANFIKFWASYVVSTEQFSILSINQRKTMILFIKNEKQCTTNIMFKLLPHTISCVEINKPAIT